MPTADTHTHTRRSVTKMPHRAFTEPEKFCRLRCVPLTIWIFENMDFFIKFNENDWIGFWFGQTTQRNNAIEPIKFHSDYYYFMPHSSDVRRIFAEPVIMRYCPTLVPIENMEKYSIRPSALHQFVYNIVGDERRTYWMCDVQRTNNIDRQDVGNQ